MKTQLMAMVTGFVAGIQQISNSPWRMLLFILVIFIMIDLLRGSPDKAKTIPMILGYVDVIAKKITIELIALIAIVMALRK